MRLTSRKDEPNADGASMGVDGVVQRVPYRASYESEDISTGGGVVTMLCTHHPNSASSAAG
jgi:hypothetical protein